MTRRLLQNLTLLAVAVVASAAAPPGTERDENEEIARIHDILFNTTINTEGFKEKTTLAQFLAELQTRLPKGKQFALSIDEKAFGKNLPRLAAARIEIQSWRMPLHTLLRKILSRVSELEEVDLAIRPPGVVVTRPRLAVHRVVYDIRSILPHLPMLRMQFEKLAPGFEQHAEVGSGSTLLVGFLLHAVELRSWETIEIRNGARLAVLCSATRHQEIATLLDALRRIADTAVVMNARLYEVDRAFYIKHVAPLFAAPKRLAVVPIEVPLLKQITGQKLLLESEEIRLQPRQEAVFLSSQQVFRFAAGPGDKKGRARAGMGLAGVSFEVHPLVNPDRRSLHLKITQKTARLDGIDQAKTLDVATGKDVAVESPNLRRSSFTGTVQIPDAHPILMPVDYRPSGKENADKIWLLVARPFIWIEEEMKAIRMDGGDASAKAIWNTEIPLEEGAKPLVPPLPLNDEVKQILQALITEVLTNEDLKHSRDFYGTAKDQTFTLKNGAKWGWPKQFKPDISGWKLVQGSPDPVKEQPRVLGVRLDKFDLKQKKVDTENAPIEVCLFNAGGTANGAVIGGCFVSYAPKWDGKRWTVELVRAVAE